MDSFQIETTVKKDGKLDLQGLPFTMGEKVVVTVRRMKDRKTKKNRYPLHGTPIQYDEPFASISEDDWDAAQ